MALRQSLDVTENDPLKVGTKYTVRNPHPGWNAEDPKNPFDPNIMNEYGHTHYPKMINHPTKKEIQRTTTYLANKDSRENIVEYDGKDGRPDIPLKVIVNNAEEEAALLAGVEKAKAQQQQWKK